MKKHLIILFIFIPCIVNAQYFDPGSGSYFFQILIGLLTTCIFYIKHIKNWVKLKFLKDDKKQ